MPEGDSHPSDQTRSQAHGATAGLSSSAVCGLSYLASRTAPMAARAPWATADRRADVHQRSVERWTNATELRHHKDRVESDSRG